MTDEDIKQIRQIVDQAVENLKLNQDRAVEAIAGEVSTLRAELGQRIDALSQRMDNLAPVIISADSRMAAFTRSVDRLITAHGETEGTMAAQQRVMEQLNARIKALEEKATGHQ